MKLVFLGPPGAGKGTSASRLSAHLGIPHISTGDIIRAAIRNQTGLGVKVKSIVEKGDLVPDDLTIELVKDRLAQKDAEKGFILDGFPRTVAQADALEHIAAPDRVINFVLDDDEIIKRLSGRRIHKPSGRTYHVLFSPPKVEGRDDVTGEALITRPDDEPDAISHSLEVYRSQTQPLIEYYRKKGAMIDLDTHPAPEKVFAQLCADLGV